MTGFPGWAHVATDAEYRDTLRHFVSDARRAIGEDGGEGCPSADLDVMECVEIVRDLATLALDTDAPPECAVTDCPTEGPLNNHGVCAACAAAIPWMGGDA